MILRKKLIGNTLSLATLSLLVANTSSAGQLLDLFNSAIRALPSRSQNSSDANQNQNLPTVPVDEVQIETHPKTDAVSVTPDSSADTDSSTSATSSRVQGFLSGESTQDSSFVFTANLPQGTTLFRIQITFNGANQQLDHVFVPVSGDLVSKRVYFAHGPGKYHIDAWYSKNPDRYSAEDQTYLGSVDVTNTDTRDLRYLLPSGDVQSDDPEIIAKAREITANARTDADKVFEIHKWITKTIEYDANAYFDGSYAKKAYDATSTLHKRVAVCYGYTNLFAALARASGLRTKVIDGFIIWPLLGQTWEAIGNTQSHAWNKVYVDGRWMIVDSTWDSGYLDFKTRNFIKKPRNEYYNLSPDRFALDHRESPESTKTYR